MKQRFDSQFIRSLTCSLILAGGYLLGWAVQAADPPAPTPAATGTSDALTLDGAVRLALENNPELRASGGRVDAATGRAYQARLWTNPELTLSAEDWPAADRGFSEAKKLVGVAQTVPFPGKKKLDRQIGASGIRSSQAELGVRRVELVRDVKTAFYQVLAAERLVEVAGELVKVAESSATTARRRVAAGAAADQEQLRAEIPLEHARTELAGFQRELASARQTLALHLGRRELSGTPLAGSLSESADMAILSRRPEQWLTNHPSVQAVKSNRDRADLELRRARLEPYPDVRFGLSGGQDSGRDGGGIVQFSLALPLPILDRSKGRKMEAEANVRIAEADQAAVEQRLAHEWGVASEHFRAAVEQVANYRERILPKATEALRLVQTGFEQGKFGFIDLLDTQRTAAEARLAYQQKLLELNVAHVELEALADAAPQSPSNPSQP